MGQKMYFKYKNPIALRSQEMIVAAMNSLMGRKHFKRITVTEICEEAGIGRKTFYRNFEQKEDVVDLQLDQLYKAYSEGLENLPLTSYLNHHFAFLEQNKDYLTLLYKNDLLPVLTEKFARILPKVMPKWSEDPTEQRFRSAYIAAGIEAIIFTWAEEGFRQSVEELCAIALRAQEKQIPVV